MKTNITKAARRVWKNFRKGVRQLVHNIKLKQNEVRPTDISYTRLAQNRVNYIQPDFDVLYRVLKNVEEDDTFRGFMTVMNDPFPLGGVNNPARIIVDPMEEEKDLEENWCEESDTTPLSMNFDDIA